MVIYRCCWPACLLARRGWCGCGVAEVVGLWAVFVVVLGVELGAGWCGDGVAAGCVGLFGDGPSVGVDGGVVLFA